MQNHDDCHRKAKNNADNRQPGKQRRQQGHHDPRQDGGKESSQEGMFDASSHLPPTTPAMNGPTVGKKTPKMIESTNIQIDAANTEPLLGSGTTAPPVPTSQKPSSARGAVIVGAGSPYCHWPSNSGVMA